MTISNTHRTQADTKSTPPIHVAPVCTRSCGWVQEEAHGRATMYRRVAQVVAAAETPPIDDIERARLTEQFEQMMSHGEFLPNSPTLVNADTFEGVLSACFVLPVGSDPEQVEDTVQLMNALHHAGSGTGFSFSDIGDVSEGSRVPYDVRDYVELLDQATHDHAGVSARGGANMGVLRVDHPAIREFVTLKSSNLSLPSFNLSVGVTDHFMQCVLGGRRFALRDPRSRSPRTRIWAGDLFKEIARAAWASGDPGIVFLDAVERANPLPALGKIDATNPCGEAPLLPYESCTLGSINLANMIQAQPDGGSEVDWTRLERTTRMAVCFLDDVIDAAHWPDKRIRSATTHTRKIGLGVMGFADMLVKMRLNYGSERSEQVATQLMAYINHVAHSASEELAEQRGSFPAWFQSVYAERRVRRRNAVCTSIAPTGTISRIAGVTPGIEPFFTLTEPGIQEDPPHMPRMCSSLQGFIHATGRDPGSIIAHIQQAGTLVGAPGLRDSETKLFRTATEIPATEHLKIQAAFQQHTDQAVAKTVNLPQHACPQQVEDVFREAWELGLKGVTVFRWGSRDEQPYGQTC